MSEINPETGFYLRGGLLSTSAGDDPSTPTSENAIAMLLARMAGRYDDDLTTGPWHEILIATMARDTTLVIGKFLIHHYQ